MITTSEKRLVVIVPMPGTYLLDPAGPCDVFTAANKVLEEQMGIADGGYEVVMAAPGPDRGVTFKVGATLLCEVSLMEIKRPIDTLIIAGFPMIYLQSGEHEVIRYIRDHYPSMRRIGSICVGTYALAEAGILDGRSATTHWEHSRVFQERYPAIKVDTNPFYTRDGNVYTSGGVSSGIDLSMALVEEDYGSSVALQVARRLIYFLKRPGYQSQFSVMLQMHSMAHSLAGKLRPWLMDKLEKEISVEMMADYCNMSTRNFNRVFHKETGLTPAKFVEKLRIEIARKYLEDSDLSMEQIAERCGMGGVVSMRRTFLRNMNLSPSDYRRTFRTSLQTELLPD